MNIFIFNNDPALSAKDFPDKYVVKMPLESAQLLCTVAFKRGFEAPYKPTHKNHPATIWLGKSSANWNWLCLHGLAICEQYTLRYNKIHKCQTIIKSMLDRTKEIWGEEKSYYYHTPFEQCMPEKYKQEDCVKAYRDYYCGEKRLFAVWSFPAKTPEWYT